MYSRSIPNALGNCADEALQSVRDRTYYLTDPCKQVLSLVMGVDGGRWGF